MKASISLKNGKLEDQDSNTKRFDKVYLTVTSGARKPFMMRKRKLQTSLDVYFKVKYILIF